MRAREPRAAAAAVVAVVAFALAVVAAVPLLAGSGGAASAATAPQSWLDRINEVRVSSGVAAVTENASWTLGIAHHLTYLEQTPLSYRTGQYASDHTENPAAPLYTADGALEASRSNLMHGKITSDVQPIDA
jgi:hypothetical protein